jgi:hypothetical protein
MVYAFPTNEKLWQQYAQLRADGRRGRRAAFGSSGRGGTTRGPSGCAAPATPRRGSARASAASPSRPRLGGHAVRAGPQPQSGAARSRSPERSVPAVRSGPPPQGPA